MSEAFFSVRVHLYNTEPASAVQLFGGPLGTIVAMTIYKNDIDETCGVLPKALPLASLYASPTRFDELCAALNAGGGCTLCITFELDDDRKRQVTDISVSVPVLLKIEKAVERTAKNTEEIYDALTTGFHQVAHQLSRTHDLLLSRLPAPGDGPNGGGPSTSPPPLDEDCEEAPHWRTQNEHA